MSKSTPEEIRERFDHEVERFSNLQTGQSATIDAPLALELIASAAAAIHPTAKAILDVGCGAGNYTLKLLKKLPGLDVTLIDLSRAMLDRAEQRIGGAGAKKITAHQGDIRALELPKVRFDVILAAAVLHHLRDEGEWKSVFAKLFASLRPGGSLWIFDLISHGTPAIQQMMWSRYGDYLTNFKNAGYREEVFAYVDKEDTPRPLDFQIDLLREVGFQQIEILHKNGPFAAFGAIKLS